MIKLENPFEMSHDELEAVCGRILSCDELEVARCVANHIKRKLHGESILNGHHHHEACWAGGPPHYMCAYNKVNEFIKTFKGDIDVLTGESTARKT